MCPLSLSELRWCTAALGWGRHTFPMYLSNLVFFLQAAEKLTVYIWVKGIKHVNWEYKKDLGPVIDHHRSSEKLLIELSGQQTACPHNDTTKDSANVIESWWASHYGRAICCEHRVAFSISPHSTTSNVPEDTIGSKQANPPLLQTTECQQKVSVWQVVAL